MSPLPIDTHATSRIASCRIMPLPRFRHENGSLTVVENTDGFPFAVKRVFYLYDVPSGAERGGHSHHVAQELIVSVSGAFDVILSDGCDKKTFTLRRPGEALYIPAGIWREINNFSGGAVCLVLTSEPYSEADYVRDREKFMQLTSCKR